MFPFWAPGIIWTHSKSLARITISQPEPYAWRERSTETQLLRLQTTLTFTITPYRLLKLRKKKTDHTLNNYNTGLHWFHFLNIVFFFLNNIFAVSDHSWTGTNVARRVTSTQLRHDMREMSQNADMSVRSHYSLTLIMCLQNKHQYQHSVVLFYR